MKATVSEGKEAFANMSPPGQRALPVAEQVRVFLRVFEGEFPWKTMEVPRSACRAL